MRLPACTLLGVLIAALPAYSATLASRTTARSIDANSCTLPKPVTSFSVLDQRFYLWFLANNTSAGDRFRADLSRPDGTLEKSASWNQLTTGGSRCFSYAEDIAGTSLSIYPGEWTLKVYNNNQHFFSTSLRIGIPEAKPGLSTTRLTSSPARDWYPIWKHDASALYFFSNRQNARSSANDLWIMSPDGSNQRMAVQVVITTPTSWGDSGLAQELEQFSGDLFVKETQNLHEFLRIGTSQTTVLPLLRAAQDGPSSYFTRPMLIPGGYGAGSLQFSATGQAAWVARVTASPTTTHRYQIRTIALSTLLSGDNLNSSTAGNPIVDTGSDGQIPEQRGFSFSPDGTQMVVAGCFQTCTATNKSTDLYIVEATTGRTIRRLTANGENGTSNREPQWARQGDWIAFVSDTTGVPEVWIVRPDGSGLARLQAESSGSAGPAWSPDGRHLVFSAVSGNQYEIYLARDLIVGVEPEPPTPPASSENEILQWRNFISSQFRELFPFPQPESDWLALFTVGLPNENIDSRDLYLMGLNRRHLSVNALALADRMLKWGNVEGVKTFSDLSTRYLVDSQTLLSESAKVRNGEAGPSSEIVGAAYREAINLLAATNRGGCGRACYDAISIVGLGTAYAADKSLYGQDQETRRATGEAYAKVLVAQLGLFDTLAAGSTSLAIASGLTGELSRVANSSETATAMFAELQRLQPGASSTSIKRILTTLTDSLTEFAVSSGNQIDLSGTEPAQDAPRPAAIVSQANSEPASAAPGARMRLLGSGLTSAPAQASVAGTTTLGDTEVWVEQPPESVAAELLSVDPSGIELRLPPGVSGPTRAVRVRRSGIESAPLYFTLSPTAAEFFEVGSGTVPRAQLSTADGITVGDANPVGPGQVINAILTGMGAWSAESGTYLLPFKVVVDGAPATILSAAPNGDYPGIDSVSFELPSGIRSGVEVPIWIEQNGRRSRQYSVPVVAAASLSSISLSAATVQGGGNVNLTVTLDRPAPADGVTVVLASDSGSVQVPSELIITVGAKSATTAVRTAAVTTSQTVRLTASYRGVNRTATLTVVPLPSPVLTGLTVAPAQVTGGQSATGVVTLSENAPTGGLEIQLLTSNAAVSVPAAVRVAAGSRTSNFSVATSPVNAATAVSIIASLNGVQRTTTLTLVPVVVASPWRDYEIWMTGTITLEGRQVATKITSSVPGIMNWAHVDTTGDFSTGLLLYAYFTNPAVSGNTVTFSGTSSLGLFQNLRGTGGGSLKSGTLTLTAAGPSVGTTVTGNLEFSTETKTFKSAFTGRIVASDRIR